MAIHNAVFASEIHLEGASVSSKPSQILFQPPGQPSLAISQPWYVRGGVATNEDIHNYLVGEGFKAVPGSYFGWFRPADGVVIVDAKPDNFIKTQAGIVALDLQLSVFDEEDVRNAGLSTDDGLRQLYIPR